MNIKESISRFLKFITVDIWRMTDNELTKGKVLLYKTIRTFILTARGFARDGLGMKASALTFSTLLAIVPTLALIFVIARGFGFQTILEETLIDKMPAQSDALQIAFGYVQSYLEYARGGVFVGVGIIILLFSVLNLFSSIESTFNDIWQVEKPRSLVRQFVDFLSIVVIIPILLIVSSGLSVFVSATISSTPLAGIFSPVVQIVMRIMPYVINCILFFVLYLIIPNTKVKPGSALFAGIFTGLAFQIFQMIYINGQIFLSSYNKIYGGFAAVPLLLLWLQISFIIFLFGGELAFASQNNKNYDFEADVQKITRRYKDFLYLVILNLIIKRFENEEPPLTAQEISTANEIPLRLTNRLISKLLEANILTEGATNDERIITYLPAFDINKMTVGLLLERLEHLGSENFKIDREEKFNKIWNFVIGIKQKEIDATQDVLIKDL